MTADKLFCQMLDRIEQLTNQNATLQRTIVELQQELKRAQDHTISPSVMNRIEQMALDTPIKPFDVEKWILDRTSETARKVGLGIGGCVKEESPSTVAEFLSKPMTQPDVVAALTDDMSQHSRASQDRSAIRAREKALKMFGVSYRDTENGRPFPRSFFTYHEMECIRVWVRDNMKVNEISETHAIEDMAEQLCVSKDLIRRIVRSQGRYSK